MPENPISPASADYLFDRDSIGSLHRRLEKSKTDKKADPVTAADLARIGNADRSAFADPIFQEQVLLSLEGRLPTRRGSPPQDPVVGWKITIADVLIEDRAAEIRAERKTSGMRGEREPRIQAAEEVARGLRLHMSAEALAPQTTRGPALTPL